jgi:hypothetical protein
MARDDTKCGYLGCRNARIDAGSEVKTVVAYTVTINTPIDTVLYAGGVVVGDLGGKFIASAPCGRVTDGKLVFTVDNSDTGTFHYIIVGV